MATQKANINIIVGIVLAAVVLSVVAYLIMNSIGKNMPPPVAALPDDNNPGATGAEPTAAEQAILNGIATRIYDDIAGVSWTGHDNDLYQEALNLSDRLVTALYNTYNQMYFTKYSQTLTQVLNSEVEYFGPMKIYTLRDRLLKLGLK